MQPKFSTAWLEKQTVYSLSIPGRRCHKAEDDGRQGCAGQSRSVATPPRIHRSTRRVRSDEVHVAIGSPLPPCYLRLCGDKWPPYRWPRTSRGDDTAASQPPARRRLRRGSLRPSPKQRDVRIVGKAPAPCAPCRLSKQTEVAELGHECVGAVERDAQVLSDVGDRRDRPVIEAVEQTKTVRCSQLRLQELRYLSRVRFAGVKQPLI